MSNEQFSLTDTAGSLKTAEEKADQRVYHHQEELDRDYYEYADKMPLNPARG